MTSTDAREAPAAAGSAPKRYVQFDGLRGLCASFVIVYHWAHQAGVASVPGNPGPEFWGRFLPALGVFLPPFFVLSGFMLYRSFARALIAGKPRPATGGFLLARAMRLLPAFWLVLLFVILLLDLSLIDSVWEFVKPFLLVFFLVTTSPVDWLPGTEHTWTVPTEMAFYLAIPVIAWATNAWARRATDAKTRTRRLLWPLWALALVGAGWTAFAFLPSNMAYAFYYYFWPIGYIGFFAAGMALAVIAAHRDVTGEVPGLHRFVARHPLLPWLAGGVVLLLNMPKPFGERGMGDWGAFTQAMTEHVAFYVFALLLVVPLTVPDARSRFIDTVLTNRPLRSIGRLSYGVYLWHVPVMYLWFRHGNIFGNEPISVLVPREQLPAAELIGFAVWVVVGTAVFTLLSYYLVERPVVRMRTRFGAPKSSLDQAYEPTPGRP